MFILYITGFTEGDCSTLYHKAIRDNPTITLHIAKAMTIGPAQVGKTALRYHLLGLPPPESSSSTPVMKTAETISVCPSDRAASPVEVGLVPSSGVDLGIDNSSDSEDASSSDESGNAVSQKIVQKRRYENRMLLVTEDEWVLVNSDSGILSLLTHLQQNMHAQSNRAPKPVDYGTVALEILPSNHEGVHHEAIHREEAEDIQPLDDKSDSVAVVSGQIYKELQNPDIAKVAMPDSHFLQFLDCGGQLAYHDILPLFVNIPAIYLNVFNVTKDLTECPIDELSTSGNKMYSAKSALSVAEMITRSVMTVHSLADRKVELPSEMKSKSKSPKPHIVLVGTHLDKLEEDAQHTRAQLKAVDETLHKALQSKSHLLEGMVLPNEKCRLMFFPVNNKLYVDEGHQSHTHCKCKHCRAIKNLKKIITKQAMEDAVEVKVPVKWYLHQLLELSQHERPLYSYSELYKHCKEEGSVTDVGEFHAMVTYFHALGLLIHLCGAGVGHTEDSGCLVFTNPSYLFENISKLYQVQFEEVVGVAKKMLKHEGKLTLKVLQELEVQLDPALFKDLLVQLFIGAEMVPHEGDRALFVPSVLTNSSDEATISEVGTGPQEHSLCFAVTFKDTQFIPCGVFTGMIARLQMAEGWEIKTKSISRMCMEFAVDSFGTVSLSDHANHISVNMDQHEGHYQKYRDTIVEAAADSYCFLFHSKAAKGPHHGPCSECMRSPYLELGQTCQKCPTQHGTSEAPHFAKLKVLNRFAESVRCQLTQTPKQLSNLECDLFQNMSHYVS